MNSTVRRAIARIAMGMILVTGAGCPKPAGKADVAPPKTDGTRVEFAPESPQLEEFQVSPAAEVAAPSLFLTGRLVWNEDATSRIVPPVSGRIEKLAPIGSRVKRGSVLSEVSSPDFGQAQSDAARAAADLAAAGRTYDRVQRLVERGAAPRKDLDAAESDLARTRAEAERAHKRLEGWGGDPGATADQLYRVRSPLAGVVVERNANVGQESRPDAALPLFVVTDPFRLWVLIDVTERDLSRVARGDRVEIRSNAYPDRTFPGRIDWIGESLDPATRTVRVRGSVEDPAGLLKAEMYVIIGDSGARPSSSVVVPAAAVLTDGDRSYCFVRESPNRFQRVNIRVGPEHEGSVPVLSGLAPGAPVVTSGGLLLASFFPSEARS